MSVQLNNFLSRKIKRGSFVTGINTGVGKTLVAASVSLNLIDQGNKVAVLKPIASGGEIRNGFLINEDAVILRDSSSNHYEPYSVVNPFVFQEPIAPYIAAQKSGVELSLSEVIRKTQPVLTGDADYIIIEGAGGWFMPIDANYTMADLAMAYGYPVILVVGIKLGALNHALLTYTNMCQSTTKIAGWVANVIDPKMLYVEENISMLRNKIDAPFLGMIPYVKNITPKEAKDFLESITVDLGQ